MVRESAFVKARRLLTEARLTVVSISPDAIAATCRGDSGHVYRCGWKAGRWYCECPAIGSCSHAQALALVTLAPITGG
jgi:hypothetical protein